MDLLPEYRARFHQGAKAVDIINTYGEGKLPAACSSELRTKLKLGPKCKVRTIIDKTRIDRPGYGGGGPFGDGFRRDKWRFYSKVCLAKDRGTEVSFIYDRERTTSSRAIRELLQYNSESLQNRNQVIYSSNADFSRMVQGVFGTTRDRIGRSDSTDSFERVFEEMLCEEISRRHVGVPHPPLVFLLLSFGDGKFQVASPYHYVEFSLRLQCSDPELDTKLRSTLPMVRRNLRCPEAWAILDPKKDLAGFLERIHEIDNQLAETRGREAEESVSAEGAGGGGQSGIPAGESCPWCLEGLTDKRTLKPTKDGTLGHHCRAIAQLKCSDRRCKREWSNTRMLYSTVDECWVESYCKRCSDRGYGLVKGRVVSCEAFSETSNERLNKQRDLEAEKRMMQEEKRKLEAETRAKEAKERAEREQKEAGEREQREAEQKAAAARRAVEEQSREAERNRLPSKGQKDSGKAAGKSSDSKEKSSKDKGKGNSGFGSASSDTGGAAGGPGKGTGGGGGNSNGGGGGGGDSNGGGGGGNGAGNGGGQAPPQVLRLDAESGGLTEVKREKPSTNSSGNTKLSGAGTAAGADDSASVVDSEPYGPFEYGWVPLRELWFSQEECSFEFQAKECGNLEDFAAVLRASSEHGAQEPHEILGDGNMLKVVRLWDGNFGDGSRLVSMDNRRLEAMKRAFLTRGEGGERIGNKEVRVKIFESADDYGPLRFAAKFGENGGKKHSIRIRDDRNLHEMKERLGEQPPQGARNRGNQGGNQSTGTSNVPESSSPSTDLVPPETETTAEKIKKLKERRGHLSELCEGCISWGDCMGYFVDPMLVGLALRVLGEDWRCEESEFRMRHDPASGVAVYTSEMAFGEGVKVLTQFRGAADPAWREEEEGTETESPVHAGEDW